MGSLAGAVAASLASLRLETSDSGAAALAELLAEHIDGAVAVGAALQDGGQRGERALADLGPALLAALQALGATPAARMGAPGPVRAAAAAKRAAAAAKRAPAAAPEADEDAEDDLDPVERHAVEVLAELRGRRAVSA